MTRAEIRRMLPLQAGALLGPLAGTGMVTLVPALSDVYGVSVSTVALAITTYTTPFALVQLFSGSVSQFLSGRLTAVVGYAIFVSASLGCALAPSFALFLFFRLVQGVGAAFLFPILMALVGEVVAPERLGRAMGALGVTQTLGLTVGPLLAGVLEVHLGWRWFFALLALSAFVSAIAFVLLFSGERETGGDRDGILLVTLTVLREGAVVRLSLAAAGLFFAMIGPYTYLAAWLKTVPQVSEDRIGLILAVSGVVGIPASAVAGGWVDRFGRKQVGTLALTAYGAALCGLAAAPYSFAATMLLAAWLGFSGAVSWTALNTLAVEALPRLRKPVASIYNAVRFLGYGLAPPLLGPVYGRDNAAAVYLVSVLVVAASAGCVSTLRIPRRGIA